ncbi:MAG: helix-turn-helix domain-containing protein [Caulobacteraceae bacterium]|nr:helix-turn-helix domain-containing protein [Caulobacteraceae bacterium]
MWGVSAVTTVPESSVRSEKALSVAWAISSEQQPDAYESYRATIADFYEVSGVADAGRRGFRSQTKAWRFGATAFARGRSVAQTLTRGHGEIRRSGIDQISIIVNLTDTIGDCDGRETIAGAGSVQFRDLARPSASRVESIDTINLVTPRTSVPSWLLGRRVHGLVLPPSSPGGRLVASHLKTLSEVAGDLTEEEGVAAVEATFVIAERFLGRTGPVAPLHLESIHRTIRQRAMQVFDARAADPSLNVNEVALAIGVSRSALYRAFGDMGGVQTYVLNRRLDRAYADLRVSGGGRLASIEDIASRYGFGTRIRFDRAFRERFGFPPSEVAPVGFVGRGAPLAANEEGYLDGAAHDVVVDWLRRGEAA